MVIFAVDDATVCDYEVLFWNRISCHSEDKGGLEQEAEVVLDQHGVFAGVAPSSVGCVSPPGI